MDRGGAVLAATGEGAAPGEVLRPPAGAEGKRRLPRAPVLRAAPLSPLPLLPALRPGPFADPLRRRGEDPGRRLRAGIRAGALPGAGLDALRRGAEPRGGPLRPGGPGALRPSGGAPGCQVSLSLRGRRPVPPHAGAYALALGGAPRGPPDPEGPGPPRRDAPQRRGPGQAPLRALVGRVGSAPPPVSLHPSNALRPLGKDGVPGPEGRLRSGPLHLRRERRLRLQV